MDDKELKKLNRRELLEMLIAQYKRCEKLENENRELRASLRLQEYEEETCKLKSITEELTKLADRLRI